MNKLNRLARGKMFRVVSVVVIFVSLGVVVQDYIAELVAVDTCLDHGGVFDYSSMTCIEDPSSNVTTLPYIPYTSRKWPLLVVSISLFCVGGAMLATSLVAGRSVGG